MTNDKIINVSYELDTMLKKFNNSDNLYSNNDFFESIGMFGIGLLGGSVGIVGSIGAGAAIGKVGPSVGAAVGALIGSAKRKGKYQAESTISKLDSILKDNYNEEKFKTYLQGLIINKGLENSEVIKRANIEKGYFYKIVRGEKIPSRDIVIQIAIALELDIKETNELLHRLGYILYGKNKRDFIIIHCIENKLNIIEIDQVLDNFKEKTLSKSA